MLSNNIVKKSLKCQTFKVIETKNLSIYKHFFFSFMIPVKGSFLDGNSERVAHVGRKKGLKTDQFSLKVRTLF